MFRPIDFAPPQSTKKMRRKRKKGINPKSPEFPNPEPFELSHRLLSPESYFPGNNDTDDSVEGSGIRFYKSPGELVERLGLLCASREAGNTSKHVVNELVEILDRLLNEKVIKKSEYKKNYKTNLRKS